MTGEAEGRPGRGSRRWLLRAAGSGVAALSLGAGSGLRPRPAAAFERKVRWVSPRGNIEVLDDYPYWVAKKFGYFGDIETTLEPGPMEATACVRLSRSRSATTERIDRDSDMSWPLNAAPKSLANRPLDRAMRP